MANTMSFGPEWTRNLPANGSNPSHSHTQGAQSIRKLPLADYRYGKEEMISLFPNPPVFPTGISNISTIVRQNCIQPLAFVPLTEEEQLALTGNVNSGSVYGGRGRGGFYGSRGGARGRGRGGRTDYHRSTSGGEEFSERGGYYRNSSDSTWNDEGRGGYQTRGGGGRALRDNNWRSTQPMGEGMEGQSQTPGWSGGGGGGGGGANNHWNTSSPGKANKSLNKDGGDRRDHWNPLPEWATDSTKKPVGEFDSKGRFSVADKDPEDDDDLANSRTEDKEGRNSGSSSPEDVFEKEDETAITGNSQPHPPAPFQESQLDEFSDKEEERKEEMEWTHSGMVVGSQPRNKESRVESVDSMEEMQRRFEKAAEAVLSTEDEDTPSPSPNPAILQQQKPPPPAQPSTKSLEDMQKWVYTDPRGELQGPFTNQEMADWFAAGYFTMDLKVRRASDVMFLPLGQVIRIWGRVPFSPGPQPPPLQQTEPFWQQMFIHQHQLFPQSQDPNTSSSQQQQTMATPPITTASVANDTSPIWGTRMSPEEEQWPDLTGGEPQLQQQLLLGQRQVTQEDSEEIMRQKLQQAAAAAAAVEEERQKAELKRLEEERLAKLEEQRRRKEEEEEKKRQREEEERRRRVEEEERQRAIEEERRKRAAEQKKREEEERLRREALERERAEAEKKREWEEMQRKLQKQKQLEEEEERKAKEQFGIHLHQHQQPLLPQQMLHPSQSTLMQQFMSEPSTDYNQQDSSTISVWTYDQPNSSAPSLLKIQQEEKVKEKARHDEERRQQLLLQQQHQQFQQQAATSGGWSSPTTPTTKPLSFLEIQQEQEKQFTVSDDGLSGVISGNRGTSKKTVVPSSWSKIAAASSKPPPSQTSPWGASPQPHPPSHVVPTHYHPPPTAPSRKETKPLSFWEECALETTTTISSSTTSNSSGKAAVGTKGRSKMETGRGGRGPVKSKEEEKVRQLFSYGASDDAFTQWCATELVKFNTDVDAATFVSLLLEVESTYEVHDYIKSFLGETDEVHSFAKQFLERRQKIRNYGQTKKSSSSSGTLDSTSSSVNSVSSSSSSSRSSKKKKKGKMQKMPPSALLGFTVNAAERPNAGEIHSVKDAL